MSHALALVPFATGPQIVLASATALVARARSDAQRDSALAAAALDERSRFKGCHGPAVTGFRCQSTGTVESNGMST